MKSIKKLTYSIIEDIEDVIFGIEKRMKPYENWGNIGNSREITVAKQIIETHRPLLIFMDWHIKGGSTYEVLDFIKNEKYYNPYIVYFTGYQKDEPEIPVKIMNDYAVDKYLVKPIWKKLSDSLALFLSEAETKMELTHTINIEDINHNILKIKPINITSITLSDSQKRTKSIRLVNNSEIIVKQTFTEIENILKEFHIDYMYTNKRFSIVTKKHIEKIENEFIFFVSSPKVEVSKENLIKIKKWM